MRSNSILYILLFWAISAISYGQAPGASFCGPYSSSPPLNLDGVSNTTISDLDISNPNGDAIELLNCNNITIERCFLHNSSGNGIQLYNCTNITIINNRFDSVATGVYAIQSQQIKVTYNDSKNVLGPFPRGQMTQFNNVTGGGNQINFNVSENIPGQSNPEDAVSIYSSNGLPNDPIQVFGNWIRGGGPSTSGSGIMLGDSGSSYTIAKDNVLVNPGQVGIGIAGGEYNQLIDNKIYSESLPHTNVGIFVWLWPGNPAGTICENHTVYGNEVNWTNKDGTPNHRWDGGNCGPITGWSNNTWNATIDESILPAQILTSCTQLRSVYCLPSLWLEGAYDLATTGMRNTLLQSNLLPAGQPYTVAPWNYNGTEGAGWISSDYPAESVDWILVSLRSTPSANDEITRFAAILLQNGTIQTVAPIELDPSIMEAYILVEHRNHLPAMSPTPVPIVNDTIRFDFRVENSYTGLGFGQKQINGSWFLYSGNADQSNPAGYEITGADNILWGIMNGTFGFYLSEDFNLDSDVNASDRIFWNRNNGISSGIEK